MESNLYTKENFNPDAPPLTDEETKLASAALIHKFPRVTRYTHIPNKGGVQKFTNMSFILFNEPKNGVYGYFRPSGEWLDGDIATTEAELVIKEVDSLSKIHLAPSGHWSPITNNEQFSLDQMDVKMKEEDHALRDRASKEKEAQNRQEQRELNERAEELKKDESDLDHDKESLDYYTKKRVSKRELQGYILQANEKIKTLKKSLRKVEKEINELNKRHPVHIDAWLKHYNDARRRVGLPDVTETDISTTQSMGQIV